MRRFPLLVPGWAGAALLALALGCAGGDAPDAASSDAVVSEKVKEEIRRSSFAEGHEITVTTEDGVVTLVGQVTAAHEVDRAEELARRVDGVRDVDNRLSVYPRDPDKLPAVSDGLTSSPLP